MLDVAVFSSGMLLGPPIALTARARAHLPATACNNNNNKKANMRVVKMIVYDGAMGTGLVSAGQDVD